MYKNALVPIPELLEPDQWHKIVVCKIKS